jgi:tetratricopeptide (TPR) repeat protein
MPAASQAQRLESTAERLGRAVALHRDGMLDDAEAMYREALVVDSRCALAFNMLGNIAYQRGRFSEALQLVAQATLIDPSAAAYRITQGHVYRRMGDLADAGRCYRQALDLDPGSALAAVSMADVLKSEGRPSAAVALLQQVLQRDPLRIDALHLLGEAWLMLERPDDAAQACEIVLGLDSTSADAAFRLGVAKAQLGLAVPAIEAFLNAAALRPDFAEAHYNLGVLAAEAQQPELAEAYFRRALDARPGYVDALVNLSATLERLGRGEEAHRHRDAAYRQQCLFVQTSPSARRTALLLFDAGKGNINLGRLFSRSLNNVVDWMIAYAPPGQPPALPDHDLVFNAMGDQDVAGEAVQAALRFVAACDKPVLNHPKAVAETARHKLGRLLAGIDGLVLPEVYRVAPADPWPAAIGSRLPVLVRPVDTHGGGGLQRIDSALDLSRFAAARTQAMYVAPFVDFRSADGCYRKYRIIFVNRVPFPYHLAISAHWLVHYATAEMELHPWKLEEEARFLAEPRLVLGSAAMTAMVAIGQRLDLDYAGIDFSLLADGRILVFEANPVMLVHAEDAGSALFFKNAYVTRILDAFESHLGKVVGGAAKRPANGDRQGVSRPV